MAAKAHPLQTRPSLPQEKQHPEIRLRKMPAAMPSLPSDHRNLAGRGTQPPQPTITARTAIRKHKILTAQIAVETIAFGGFSYILLYLSPLAIVGIITTVTSLAFKVWGQPAQILLMYKQKSSEGISWTSHAIAAVSYVAWCLYGLRTDNWVIVASQSLGMVGSLLTLHLIFQYRSSPPAKQGILFWVWDDDHDRWQKVTFFDYTRALDRYMNIANPVRHDPATPWYWAAQYAGKLLQGTATDANVPENPSLQEIIDGITRLCDLLKKEKTWTTRMWNWPSSP
jgi:uncharacterized protein with PQ loop repeat